MPFTILPAEPDDIPYLTDIQWAALAANPLIQILYPRGPTHALAAFTTDSYNMAMHFPSVRLMKAVDEETGEIVAFAKWILYPQERGESVAEKPEEHSQNENTAHDGGWTKRNAQHIPPNCDVKALKDWGGRITKTRQEIMNSRKHSCDQPASCSLECYFSCFGLALWVLDIIHTHPLHQGRGAGAELIKWGTDLADKQGFHCYLESSPAAYSLAKRFDFEDIEDICIDLRKYNERHGKYEHTVMTRPPNVPPRLPPKDLPNPVQGYWDFGLLNGSSDS